MKKTIFLTFLMWTCFLLPVLAAGGNEADRQAHGRVYKDIDPIRERIEQMTTAMKPQEQFLVGHEIVHAREYLPQFYSQRGFKPAWSDHGAFADALAGIEGSYLDGLNPEDYHLQAIRKVLEDAAQPGGKDVDPALAAGLDILITDAVFYYAYHLLDGKSDPHTLDADWNLNYNDIPDYAPEILAQAIDDRSVSDHLAQLRPDFIEYPRMMDELALYRKIREQGGWGTIEASGKIDPGSTDPRIPLIRQRLKLTNELSEAGDPEGEQYDTSLEADIRSFQDRHGLTPDGVIGKGTFAALNMPVEQKIDMIRINMERARWIIHNIPPNTIAVNIARFKAFVEHDFNMVHQTNVIVGKEFHKTPVFRADLAYIEFNPTWTVPVSIVKNEMLAKIKADPGYLGKNNMVLLDGAGNVVPVSSVDIASLSANHFPYTVRQEPGPWNALGVVKFIFPNEHSVFLHDTEARGLFSNTTRAFSHGCIRVQNPLDLAEVLLRDTEWDRNKIDELVASKETKRVIPRTKYEVFLLYWTSGVVEAENKVFFLPDVYDRDPAVLKALDKKVSQADAGR